MSFQNKQQYGSVVVCDLCGRVGAMFDHDWHEMRRDAADQPIHLCRECRRTAIWCAFHEHYHHPAENHRRSCAMCGGLFTAPASLAIDRCPSCRRAAPEQPSVPAQPSPAHKRIIAKLFGHSNGSRLM